MGSARITSKGNEGLLGLIEERDGTNNVTNVHKLMLLVKKMPLWKADKDVTKEIPAKWFPMDQTDTTQLSNGKCSQVRCLTGKSTSSLTNESSPPREQGQKFDVFLSHSGKQKIFVRQLYRDLTNQGFCCFFDEDSESLPVAEHFPSRIFDAAETCKVAVVLISEDFLESKWPMQELSAFVKVRDITRTNPNPKILPLFFLISPAYLKNTKKFDKKWKQFKLSKEVLADWHKALATIRGINGLQFGEGGNEVEFRDEIVKTIWRIIPSPSARYHVPCMQGEVRMCQEIEHLFKVKCNEKGIHIARLYGIAGHGKTTLGKAFCNSKLVDFEGRVCHLEFSRGDPFERIKLALQYLTNYLEPHRQRLTNKDQAQTEFHKRVKGKRILLVLDDITEESRDEVIDYISADVGENSWILLSARSDDILKNHFQIDKQSCMRVPSLEEDEAIAILLKRVFPGVVELEAEDRHYALKCAHRCLFKDTSSENVPRARIFHPLALKAFGGYLSSKHGLNLSKWVAEIDVKVDEAGNGLDEVFDLLGKAFDGMDPKYRTIFMLLTVYMLPNMSLDKVIEWMAMNCNEEIPFIFKAVEDLQKAAFIEEFKPEIRIHDLYIEFAQSKANKMERWLWWKQEDDQCSRRQLIAQDKEGFELAKLEHCMYRRIAPHYLGNLLVLQLVDVQDMRKLDLGPMKSVRSITLLNCKVLVRLDGMENSLNLAWLQIRGVSPMFKLPELGRLEGLQYLELNITGRSYQLGDLTHCSSLREIYVVCPYLLEFPRLKGMKHLEKVEFSLCDEVKGPLDCTNCVKLQTVVLNLCCQMAAPPLLVGCKELSKLVLSECDAVMTCPDINVPNALRILELFISSEATSAPKSLEPCSKLETLQLWNMGKLMKLPSFRPLSKLSVLKLGKCGIKEPPDLTYCVMLEDVFIFQLRNLVRFPNFSSLRELKRLSLCDCISVQDPPDIEGCHKLQVLHLLYNDNLKGIPKVDKCAQLEEIKVSWHCEDEVTYEGFDPESCQVVDDLESCLDYWKFSNPEELNAENIPVELKWWMKWKSMLVTKYFRGVKLYYSVTVPSELYPGWQYPSPCPITLRLVDSKVMAFPTLAREHSDAGIDEQLWVHKVRKYFEGREDIPCASAASVVSGAACNKVDVSLPRPPSPRYHVKMRKITPRELQGMGSSHFEWRNVDHKVCHLGFCEGNTLARKNLALRRISQFSEMETEWFTSEEEAHFLSNTIVKRKRVLLVLDNITEARIDEMRYYLGVKSGKERCILWSARSVDQQNCDFYPCLGENAITISLKRMSPEEASRAERSGFDLANSGLSFVGDYLSNSLKSSPDEKHLIAWKMCAQQLLCKYRSNLLDLVAHRYYVRGILHEAESKEETTKLKEKLSEEEITKLKEKLSSAVVEARVALIRYIQKSLPLNVLEWWLEEMWKETTNMREEWTESCYIKEGVERRLVKMRKEFAHIKEELFSDDFLEQQAIWWKKDIEDYHLEMLAIDWKKVMNINLEKDSDNIVKRLVEIFSRKIKHLNEANAFMKEFEPANTIRGLVKEFVQIKKGVWEKGRGSHIVEEISFLLSLSPRYRVPVMQGEARMCQELADFFNTVHPNEKGIRIAGLYGMPGLGKTTLSKAFCNSNLRNFDAKVCHLEFCGSNKLDRQKLFLRYLTQFPMPHLESSTNVDDELIEYYRRLKGQKVLLVLDNIAEESIDEVKYYLGTELGENSCILLSTRNLHVLENDFKIESQSCMHVPRLEEDEAIAILQERKPSMASGFPADTRDFALKCAKKCSFKDDEGFTLFHPLALKVFGRHLFRKQSRNLSKRAAEIDGLAAEAGDGSNVVFTVLNEAFNGLDYRCRTAFMLLTTHKPPNMSAKEAYRCLAINCNEGIAPIKKAVAELCESAFIEEIEPEIRVHALLTEYAQMRNKTEYDTLDEVKPREKIVITPLLQPSSQMYCVPPMQGASRMCQEIAELFNTVHPNRKGIRIAGLYGMPGQGKTTLGKTFCNLNSWNFNGNVYHLEFCGFDRQKLAPQYLTNCSKSELESLKWEGEARKMFYERVRGQRVLLVIDNITEERIGEVKYYLAADLGENSWVLLSARSEKFLTKNFNVNSESCMSVPGLQEEEAIAILLESTSLAESALGAEDRDSAMQCANRCSFKKTSREIVEAVHTFHPLALKTSGRHLFSKYGADLSQWVNEADGLVFASGDDLDAVCIVLYKAFDYIYVRQKAFIEEIEPETHIHDPCVEFAQGKAGKIERWLWCTAEAEPELFSKDETGYELTNVEYNCQHLDLSRIGDKDLKNLWALQVVDGHKEMSDLRFSLIKHITSVTSHNCEYLGILGVMDNLPYLALLHVGKVPDFKFLNSSSLPFLQYLHIDIGYIHGPTELGDLTGCGSLREIYVSCPSLWEFPLIDGLLYLEKASFKGCWVVEGALNCSNCKNLRSIVLEDCYRMADIPLIVGCSNLSKIVLSGCDSVRRDKISSADESSASDILELYISSEDASGPRHSECYKFVL